MPLPAAASNPILKSSFFCDLASSRSSLSCSLSALRSSVGPPKPLACRSAIYLSTLLKASIEGCVCVVGAGPAAERACAVSPRPLDGADVSGSALAIYLPFESGLSSVLVSAIELIFQMHY